MLPAFCIEQMRAIWPCQAGNLLEQRKIEHIVEVVLCGHRVRYPLVDVDFTLSRTVISGPTIGITVETASMLIYLQKTLGRTGGDMAVVR